MTRTRFWALVAAAAPAAFPVVLLGQTFHTQKYDIGGQGFFDYLTVDTATDRVFVSRGTHIQVVDAATGEVVGEITDLPASHAPARLASAPWHNPLRRRCQVCAPKPAADAANRSTAAAAPRRARARRGSSLSPCSRAPSDAGRSPAR